MDTHRLKYFLRIAEVGSLSRAARVLGVAQPALSRQVRLLEEELGVKLFRRTSRGVHLTEEGERLRATTAVPLRKLELAMQYLASPLARIDRGLHLGLPETASCVLAAPLLGSLSTAFPKVSLSVSIASTDQLVEALLRGAIDVALINPVPDDRLFYNSLVVEDLVVIGGPMSGLQPSRAISFAELAGFPLILPSSKTGIGNSLENTALRLQVRISSRFSTDSIQVSKDLVEGGSAYCVLPLSACGSEVETGRLRYAPLCEPTLTQQLGMAATSKLELPTEFATKVGEIIREETARLVRSGTWPARFIASQPEE